MRARAALLLGTLMLASGHAYTQAAATHEVQKGDTLFRIAEKYRYPGITRMQMLAAIQAANPGAFKNGNIDRLQVGTVLSIPGSALSIPAPASRPAVPPLAVPVPLTPGAAAARYQSGLDLEGKGDLRGALAAFTEAAESGNGLAQRKLGQIYDRGNAVVSRDYQEALKWYQKARDQGVAIDKPLNRTPVN